MRVFILIIFLFSCYFVQSQVVFQVERFNESRPEKYYAGSTIVYKTKDLSNEWQVGKIVEIKDKEQMLLFENGYIQISDIIKLRKFKPVMNGLSKTLYTFGGSWFLFGGVAAIGSDFEPGWDTVAIGGSSLLAGWIFGKFRYQTTTINKRNRLRIIDLSWP